MTTSPPPIDSSAHRRNRNYPTRVLLARVLWALLQPCFRFSPRHLYGWRNFLLRCMGAEIGSGVRIYPSARIFYPWCVRIADEVTIGWDVELYSLGPISVGAQTIISQRAHLCAGSHDYEDPTLPLVRPPIRVGAGVWICADAFVGPGVTISDGAVVAARSVVVRDVAPDTLVAGNPARPIRSIQRKSR